MKKYIYIVLVITIIAALFTIFSNRVTRDLALEEEIVALLEQGEKEINLNEMATFDWTKAELFGPYTPNETIEESMDITFKGDNGNIDLLDCCFLLVFANDKYAVKTVMLPMHYDIDGIRDQHMLLIQEK